MFFEAEWATILTVPVDKDGMRVDILQNSCDKRKPKIIYTIPTFHNLTGSVMSLKRRRQHLDIAQSIQCLIKPPASIKSMDNNGHVIYLKGISKTVALGCRIGIIDTKFGNYLT
jgi:DNA-binding transcriptional MocR family regulator